MVTINNNLSVLTANTGTNSQNSGLAGVSIPNLSVQDIQSLSITQISSLSSAQLAAFSTTQIQGLGTAQIAALSTTQIQGLGTAQIAALSTEQMLGLTTGQLAALNKNQVDALSSLQIASLTTSQISNFVRPERLGSPVQSTLPPIAEKIASQGYFPDNQIALFSYLSQTAITVAASAPASISAATTGPVTNLAKSLAVSEVQT